MLLWGRPFIDDLIIAEKENQRAHDMKLTTILHNLQRRGFAVNATKSTILGESLEFLGMTIDQHGIKPYIKEGVFNRLKTTKHRTAKDLQRTIGTLNWFRRFIPAYSSLTCLLQQSLKQVGAGKINDDSIDKICIPIIQTIELQLMKKINLAYPDYKLDKYIHIQVRKYAFSSAIYKKSLQQPKQLIEF